MLNADGNRYTHKRRVHDAGSKRNGLDPLLFYYYQRKKMFLIISVSYSVPREWIGGGK
jgi:hypothetical protein